MIERNDSPNNRHEERNIEKRAISLVPSPKRETEHEYLWINKNTLNPTEFARLIAENLGIDQASKYRGQNNGKGDLESVPVNYLGDFPPEQPGARKVRNYYLRDDA